MIVATLLVTTVMVAGCGGAEEDKLRTVKSFDFASCVSGPTTDPTEIEAIEKFRARVRDKYFTADGDALFAANHESTLVASGLREYEGPFYIYVHTRRPEKQEIEAGVDWAATLFLHARNVRARPNEKDWNNWQSVRTRNFTVQGRTVEGIGRWKCLLGAEISWAEVRRERGVWVVTPSAVGVYEGEEIERALPIPSQDQIKGTETVAPL
jgi:hypothetical protein